MSDHLQTNMYLATKNHCARHYPVVNCSQQHRRDGFHDAAFLISRRALFYDKMSRESMTAILRRTEPIRANLALRLNCISLIS